MKLWAGRFSKETNKAVNDFNSSINVDYRMAAEDIRGSIAHATMLASSGIISQNDVDDIIIGLTGILKDLKNNTLEIDKNAEDIHMFVEAELTNRIGDAGKRLHTARSRNDQVALDIRLHLQKRMVEVLANLDNMLNVICSKAKENSKTVMPGYTHLQRAQPITLGHHLMAYAQMLLRDRGRIIDANSRMMQSNPLGSGALAGTTYDLDRYMTSQDLGFEEPCANSLDGVSDRDFCLEIASALAILMMHLSRFSEEIILWCSWEFKFIELDDAFATGSSIMPQKKNPDIAELVRGKTGRVYGDLIALLTVMKGLPLAYNKDMQEDKELIFDSIDTTVICLSTFAPMIETMTVLPNNMRNAAASGFINATDCADYLVKKGLAFRDAYKITGEIVAYCIQNNTNLEKLQLEQYRLKSDLFDADVYEAISLDTCVSQRKSYGGPTTESVMIQIERVQKILFKDK